MIFHEHRCIFIHIPKCAGSSITEFFLPNFEFDIFTPNYNVLFGWCPKRKIHLQHATVKQLLETKLITEEQWNSYFKFTFVRNPWDRAYSDFLWMKKELGVNDSFKNFLLKEGKFYNNLRDYTNIKYRGDHLLNQTEFFDLSGQYKLDYVGKFENFDNDIKQILTKIGISEKFNSHINKSDKRLEHYSKFYNKHNRNLVSKLYRKDIEKMGYQYVENKTIIEKLIKIFS